jgi:uncharacterized iron-regulated protein
LCATLALVFVSSCKEAIGPLAAVAADLAIAAAAEGIRQAMASDPDSAPDPAMPDDDGHRRLVVHPLGNLIATRQDGVIGPRTFAAAMQRADVVWIALRYDNPDQFRAAAKVVESIDAFGTRPALLFAAIPEDEQERLAVTDPSLTAPSTARLMADSLPWSSWGIDTPAMLEPLLGVAVGHKLPLTAAGYPAVRVRMFAAGDPNTEEGRALGLDRPWSMVRRDALQNALTWERCAPLPDAVKDSLVLVDRAKSAGLARRVLAALPAAGKGPRVIVLTDVHRGRRDVGAPSVLAELAAKQGRTVAQYAVGMIEVDAERTEIEQYDVEASRHSALWLTPALHDPPCTNAAPSDPPR